MIACSMGLLCQTNHLSVMKHQLVAINELVIFEDVFFSRVMATEA